jgi:hypothetical protein
MIRQLEVSFRNGGFILMAVSSYYLYKTLAHPTAAQSNLKNAVTTLFQ